jgi:hypothetical protein
MLLKRKVRTKKKLIKIRAVNKEVRINKVKVKEIKKERIIMMMIKDQDLGRLQKKNRRKETS